MFLTTRKPYNISQLLKAMLDQEGLTDHAQTLVGPRTQGSISGKGLDSLQPFVRFHQLEEGDCPEGVMIPGCIYLVLKGGGLEVDGRIGAMLHGDLPPGTAVSEREGQHGPEKFVDVPPELDKLPPAYDLTVILGPAPKEAIEAGWPSERLVIWTWHPGMPLDQNKAVKLHNGGGAVKEAEPEVEKVIEDQGIKDIEPVVETGLIAMILGFFGNLFG